MTRVFSKLSQERLDSCAPQLRLVMRAVLEQQDCTILCGHRNQEDQEKAFAEGKSKLHWPHGRHNSFPSYALDAAPYPIDWTDRERLILFAGRVLGTAAMMGVNLRWGGDWDGDGLTKDETFQDLVHFELI